jgi:hypothetical protein
MFDPALLVFVLIMALIVGGGAYLAWKAHSNRVEVWGRFVKIQGLGPRGLRIEGTYEGFPVMMENQTRGAGRSRYTVAVLRLSVGSTLPPEFSLEPEGLGDKMRHLFGTHDPEIGDPRFDQLFDLKNLSPETVSVLRDEGVQRQLYGMVKAYAHFHIRDGWIQAERRRVPAKEEDLEEFLSHALQLARALGQATQRS